LNADHLLLMIRQESETLGAWKRLQDDPKWQAIPAVQRHRLCFLTSDPWREYSAYAHLRMLKQAVRLLSAVRPS
jgi:ABC-type Fe3+-hydroxamate transport system substrate-binding protein